METKRLDMTGAIGAFVAAATFVIGLLMFITLLRDYTTAAAPADAVAFLVDNRTALYLWNLIITIVFGVALVPLVLALHDRLTGSPTLSRIATVFGLIWVGLIIATGMIINIGHGTVVDLHETDPEMAVTVWSAVDTVANGLGGGNEIVGGVWVLLVTLAAARTGAFGRTLNSWGLGAGLGGLVTVIPGLESVGAVFGLGLIVWFGGVGFHLLRSRDRRAQQPAPLEPSRA